MSTYFLIGYGLLTFKTGPPCIDNEYSLIQSQRCHNSCFFKKRARLTVKGNIMHPFGPTSGS